GVSGERPIPNSNKNCLPGHSPESFRGWFAEVSPETNIRSVRHQKKRWGISLCRCLFFTLLFLVATSAVASQKPKSSSPKTRASLATKKAGGQDDSSNSKPAADLALRLEGAPKADALTHFVEGMSLEENGETDRALEAYRKVLNVDPGQSQLASRVAG